MGTSQHDLEFKLYRRTWQHVCIPAFVLLAAWVYLWFVYGWPEEGIVYWIPMVRPGSDFAAFFILSAMLLHKLAILAPMLAWAVARRRLRAASSLGRPSSHAYRSVSEPRVWYVSARLPWWPLVMVCASLFFESFEVWGARFIEYVLFTPISAPCHLLPPSLFVPCLDLVKRGMTIAALAHAVLLYVWWRRCKTGAARVGVIERSETRDGPEPFVLRTSQETRPVMLSRVGTSPDLLRMSGSGSPEVWRAVAPVDDLLRSESSLSGS